MKNTDLFTEAQYDGPVYEEKFDASRLRGQTLRIFNAMMDGKYRTFEEIAAITKDPVTSISAQLRHLRKRRFGAHTIEKKPRGDRADGLWQYKLIVNHKSSQL